MIAASAALHQQSAMETSAMRRRRAEAFVRRGLRGGAWHRLEAIRPKPGGDRRRLSCVGQRNDHPGMLDHARGVHWVCHAMALSFPGLFVASHGPERPAALRNCNGEVRTVILRAAAFCEAQRRSSTRLE